MSRLAEKLAAGEFVVTAEIAPPKGADFTSLVERARILAPHVSAVNVTDNQRAVMRASALGAAIALKREGLEPILQLTCRDRNRIALQSDLLTAGSFGIENILCLTGDHVSAGDHPEAKAVFDLESVSLVAAASHLNEGEDIAGNRLSSPTRFFIGVAAHPSASPQEPLMAVLAKKVAAGASFAQTQAVFDLEPFKLFMDRASSLGIYVLAGILVIRSARMARFANENIPGVLVPEHFIAEIERGEDPVRVGLAQAARTIERLKGICHGVHLMTVGHEELIPRLVEAAGL
jgi:5,10-methylenetetrahydrofolate reductase